MDKATINAKIDNFIEYGRKQITTKKQLEQFPIGSLISYTNIDGDFRVGGYIFSFHDDFFIYFTHDFSAKRIGKYRRIVTMWVGDVFSTVNDFVSITPSQQSKTSNFPVIVNDITLYYAKNSFDAKRFKNTDKFKRIQSWCDIFLI